MHIGLQEEVYNQFETHYEGMWMSVMTVTSTKPVAFPYSVYPKPLSHLAIQHKSMGYTLICM